MEEIKVSFLPRLGTLDYCCRTAQSLSFNQTGLPYSHTHSLQVASFPGLPCFCSLVCVQYNTRKWTSNEKRSSVYYTECKPKNKNGAGLGTRLAYRLYPNDFSACCSSCPSMLPDLSLSNLHETRAELDTNITTHKQTNLPPPQITCQVGMSELWNVKKEYFVLGYSVNFHWQL